MKRKKKGMSALTRVLLVSLSALMLVLTFFIIDWAMKLPDANNPGKNDTVGAFVDIGKDPGRTSPAVTETVTPEPTATPIPPQAQFEAEYDRVGEYETEYSFAKGVAGGARYPAYENEVAREAARKLARDLVEEKREELAHKYGSRMNCTVTVDYEDGETAGLYSVLFHIETTVAGEKKHETKQWLFNKKKNEVADAESLFAERAYLYLAEKVNSLSALPETGDDADAEIVPGAAADMSDASGNEAQTQKLSGTREEFSEFVLTADGAKFYFEKDGVCDSILVPYVELHTYMAVTVNGTVVQETIRELDPDKPMIALTFDDGPHYQQTPRLLEVLEKNDVKVTFFVLGDRSHFSESNKKTVKMVAEAGHEIASHTYAHKDLKTLTPEELMEDLTKARENLFALTGEYPTFVRPPYGSYNDDTKKYSYAPLVAWNLDSGDWNYRDTEKVIDHVLEEAGDGKIVLMHDIHWFTVDAVEVLIPALTERGYQIVTVRELLYYKNVELENGKVYHSSYN